MLYRTAEWERLKENEGKGRDGEGKREIIRKNEGSQRLKRKEQ
jgi:hypothetical protein